MSTAQVLLQQLITGLSNGAIIALIALGYTIVYGIVELINFAHGDLFMLGCFVALLLLGMIGWSDQGIIANVPQFVLLFLTVPLFCAVLNWSVDRVVFRSLRNAPRLAPLVSAIGVSFIFLNAGLFLGGVPLEVVDFGRAAAAPKDFPSLVSDQNLLGESLIYFGYRDLIVLSVTLPLLGMLTLFIKKSRIGKAMRAVAQNPTAARLMGIDVERVIGAAFALGGALAGAASIIYSLYNNTIYFQMGYRVGMDAFSAAVLGGIGSLPGACLGGFLIGLIRALSDGYLSTSWTNCVVFAILIFMLVVKPSGLLGSSGREKV